MDHSREKIDKPQMENNLTCSLFSTIPLEWTGHNPTVSHLLDSKVNHWQGDLGG